MIVRPSDGIQVLLSVVAWILASFLVGFLAVCWPEERLARVGPLTRLRRWEAGGAWWQRRLRVRAWKDRLPEAGGLMPGGRSMRHIRGRTTEALIGFRADTVRAERVHWLIFSSLLVHLIWCRFAVFAGMAVFAVVMNAPFIVIQRYNRGRLETLIASRVTRGVA